MVDIGIEIAAENIDHLASIEIHRPAVVRGFKALLYQVARDASDGPLSLRGAETLNGAPCRIAIAIVTGAAVPDHMPVGENDGPFGSTVLATTLERLGHTVSIVTDPACAAPIAALLARASATADIVELRMNDAAQQDRLGETADILVAVERLGGNPNGHLYGMTANARDAFRCNVDRLFTTHTQLGRTSLAIGDGGNEIGFGAIRATLAARLPQIAQADKTACGGGVFSVVPTTRLLVASSSISAPTPSAPASRCFAATPPCATHPMTRSRSITSASASAWWMAAAAAARSPPATGSRPTPARRSCC